IYYFSNGKEYPGTDEFKERVRFIGDINKKDASIQLSPALFSDNGTFFCDVKNPPDVTGTQARTELRVVLKVHKVPTALCYLQHVSQHRCAPGMGPGRECWTLKHIGPRRSCRYCKD
ncbi:hypothetical protein AMECASPLE_020621, partial [Ameca splendens]